MNMQRREFMELVGISVATASTPALGAAIASSGRSESIQANGWQLHVSEAGEIVSFNDGDLELVNRRLGSNRPMTLIGEGRLYRCEQPSVSHRKDSGLAFRYDFSGEDTFSMNYEISLLGLPQGATALRQKLSLRTLTKISNRIKMLLPRNILLPFESRKVFLPLKNGVGRHKPIMGFESEDEYVFSFAGTCDAMGKPQLLAIPMVDEYADRTDLHLTFCTDPLFTSYFFLPTIELMGQFNCVYLSEIGVEETEERTIYTGLHRGNSTTAMDGFYATSLPDVKPGPDWLHDVALVDFDYLSKNGRGWFADIDALTRLVEREDRKRVFLALHGWYDYVGRYAFDPRTSSLDKKWTAFPTARDKQVQGLGNVPNLGPHYPVTGYQWRTSSIKKLRPVPMSLSEMHHRIHYAKDRGFRVGLYYADGMNSCDHLKDVWSPEKVLRWGGWVGPDTKGRTYTQNPLHPAVRRFYTDYIHALLEEFKDVDGFIWDETFTVGPHDLGPEPYTGYADRAMMTLVKEVATLVADFSPKLALFASDDIGLLNRFDEAAPYCLVAHGTYQDSWFSPVAWPFGLFPNYRNVIWGCNWAPVTRFDFSRYGVETYEVPVPISNGAWGDDIGISEMTGRQQKEIMDLFNKRKNHRMEIRWVEEEAWNPTYDRESVELKWSW